MLPRLEFISARTPFLKSRLVFLGSISLYVFAAALGVVAYALSSDPIILEESLKMSESITVALNP